MPTLPLVPLRPEQFDAATDLLSASFEADPLFNYLVPADVPRRLALMQSLFRMLLLCGSGAEQSYTLVDDHAQTLKGLAIWMPPGQSLGLLDLLWTGLYQLPLHLPWAYLPRWWSALEMDRRHAQAMPAPHWYLMLLAVSPAYQRQGVGHQLLQWGVEQSDRQGHPCYLETSTEGAVRFYQRHGFDIVETGPFGSEGPPFWTLARSPQAPNPPASPRPKTPPYRP